VVFVFYVFWIWFSRIGYEVLRIERFRVLGFEGLRLYGLRVDKYFQFQVLRLWFIQVRRPCCGGMVRLGEIQGFEGSRL